MKWADLSPKQRNALVAKKVMGWNPAAPCGGHFEPLDPSPDGLYCRKCGAEIGWGDEQEHDEGRPEPYSEDIGVAWKIVEKMLARQEEEHYSNGFEWQGPQFKPSHHYLTNEGYPLGTTCWYVYLCVDHRCRFVCAATPQEAVCLAALKAVGVEVSQ